MHYLCLGPELGKVTTKVILSTIGEIWLWTGYYTNVKFHGQNDSTVLMWEYALFLESLRGGVPGWHRQLCVWLLVLAQVVISGSWDRALCQALRQAPHSVQSLLNTLSHSPAAPPLLSKINKSFKKKNHLGKHHDVYKNICMNLHMYICVNITHMNT